MSNLPQIEVLSDRDAIDVMVTRRGRVMGKLTAEYRAGCRDDLRNLREQLGKDWIETYVVTGARIDSSLFNQGWGVRMYLAAAKEAAAHECAMAPHACIGVGGTSAAANRVWNSRRVSAEVLRAGRLIYWLGTKQPFPPR